MKLFYFITLSCLILVLMLTLEYKKELLYENSFNVTFSPIDGKYGKWERFNYRPPHTIEKTGHYIYQFNDGKIGRRICYTIKATDLKQPLAYSDETKRNECLYVLSETKYGISFQLSSERKIIWIKGKYIEGWNEEGQNWFTSSVDFENFRLSFFEDGRMHITTHSNHGKAGASINNWDTDGSLRNSLPIHKIEIEVYVK